jgi:hypothetical protein
MILNKLPEKYADTFNALQILVEKLLFTKTKLTSYLKIH